MKIFLATEEDITQVAKIHYKEINQGFLNQLGEKFLYYFYKTMINSSYSFLIVAREDDNIIGFVSGCINLRNFYREFFKKYFFQVFLILLKKVFNKKIIKSVFETIRYSQKTDNLPKAELISIAVPQKFQGLGVGKKILEKFISEMEKRNIKYFKVIVGKNLHQAIKFYERNGFNFYSEKYIHKNQPSRIYLYNIKNNLK